MKKQYTQTPANQRIYPGSFQPAPINTEELKKELMKPHEGAAEPMLNVLEENGKFIVELASPGLQKEDFLIKISDNRLRVYVLHKDNGSGTPKLYHHHGFNYECFSSRVLLPDTVDADFMRAEYRDGILRLVFPKATTARLNNVERVIVY
jgi:HSP20 family protein